MDSVTARRPETTQTPSLLNEANALLDRAERATHQFDLLAQAAKKLQSVPRAEGAPSKETGAAIARAARIFKNGSGHVCQLQNSGRSAEFGKWILDQRHDGFEEADSATLYRDLEGGVAQQGVRLSDWVQVISAVQDGPELVALQAVGAGESKAPCDQSPAAIAEDYLSTVGNSPHSSLQTYEYLRSLSKIMKTRPEQKQEAVTAAARIIAHYASIPLNGADTQKQSRGYAMLVGYEAGRIRRKAGIDNTGETTRMVEAAKRAAVQRGTLPPLIERAILNGVRKDLNYKDELREAALDEITEFGVY